MLSARVVKLPKNGVMGSLVIVPEVQWERKETEIRLGKPNARSMI